MLAWIGAPLGMLVAYLRVRREYRTNGSLPLWVPLFLLVAAVSTFVVQDTLEPWRLAVNLFLLSASLSMLAAKAWSYMATPR